MTSAWLPTVTVAFAATCLLTGFGWLLIRALGIRVADGLLVAPSAGFGVFLVSGVVASALGYPFTWWAGLLTMAAVVASAGMAARLWRHDSGDGLDTQRPVKPARWTRADLTAAVVTAWVVMHAVLIRGMATPSAIPPGPDTVQGLGMAQYLSERSSADFLHAGEYMWTLDVTYPGGFQSLIATVFSWTDLSVIESAHAAMLVMGAYVLPFGTIAVARAVLGRRPLSAWAAALACVTFAVSPYFVLVAGPAWSNFASLALLPSLMAVAIATVQTSAIAGLARLSMLAGILVVAIGACQPSSLFAAAPLLLPMALTSRGRVVNIVGAAAALVTVLGWALLAPSFMLEYPVGGADTVREGVLVALKNDFAPLAARHAVLISLLLLGLVTLASRRSTVWVPIGWLVLALAWMAPALVTDELAARLLWPWWNSGIRALAALAVPSAIAVAAGAVTAVGLLDRGIARLTSREGTRIGTGVVAVALALAGITGLPASVAIISSGYQVDKEEQTWVTGEEFQALGELGDSVEPGSVVAENPYRGGAYMYITSGVKMLYPGRTEWLADGPALLGRSLVDVQTDPAVCRAVEQYSVDYVLVGGAPAKDVTEDGDFVGVDAVDDSRGFTEFASAGPYTLYRVPSCSSE